VLRTATTFCRFRLIRLAKVSGLGLAIVDNVMKQIGGSLTLISPVMGCVSGFEARLVFPEPT